MPIFFLFFHYINRRRRLINLLRLCVCFRSTEEQKRQPQMDSFIGLSTRSELKKPCPGKRRVELIFFGGKRRLDPIGWRAVGIPSRVFRLSLAFKWLFN